MTDQKYYKRLTVGEEDTKFFERPIKLSEKIIKHVDEALGAIEKGQDSLGVDLSSETSQMRHTVKNGDLLAEYKDKLEKVIAEHEAYAAEHQHINPDLVKLSVKTMGDTAYLLKAYASDWKLIFEDQQKKLGEVTDPKEMKSALKTLGHIVDGDDATQEEIKHIKTSLTGNKDEPKHKSSKQHHSAANRDTSKTRTRLGNHNTPG